jgi:Fe-S-cluster containining protein
MSPDEPPSVQVDFTLAIGPGRLAVSINVPSASVTLTQFLPVLQTLTSAVIDAAVEVVHSEGHRISCHAGCGACCRQLVPLSLFEAEYLAAWIRTLPEARQAVLAMRFHNALIALRDAGILARMESFRFDASADSVSLGFDYLAQRVPCPFLEDESCSIHPIRPLICREYLVTSPPEFCYTPSRDKVSPVDLPVKFSKTLFQIGSAVEPGTLGLIPLVFLFAWMKSGATPGDVVRATGPEMLRGIVETLAGGSTSPTSPPSPDL